MAGCADVEGTRHRIRVGAVVSVIEHWPHENEADRALDAFNSIIAKVQVPREDIEGAKVIVSALTNYKGAVEDRAKLLRWIHEVSGHFVDDAEHCRSCAVLIKYLELDRGPSGA